MAAALVSGGALAVLRPILRRVGVVDEPNARSSHVRPTLRGGGVGPLVGVIVGVAGAVVAAAFPSIPLVISGIITAAFGLLGLVEDVRGLPVWLRAGLQLVLGLAGAAALAVAGHQSFWVALVCGVLIAAYVNITNFMDGVNGISGMHGIVTGLSYAAVGGIVGVPWIAYFGLLVAAVFAAFLPWNLSRPGIFLGDVGSYALGASVSMLAVAALMIGVPILTVLAPVLIYLVDTMSTLIRRGRRGEPVLRPHRTHAYQRLTDTGLSHIQAALIVSAFTAASSLVGLSIIALAVNPLIVAVAMIVLSALYLALPRMRGNTIPRPTGYSLPPVDLDEAPIAQAYERPRVWAVVGASGFVGSALVRHLRSKGYEVRELAAPRLELDPETRDLESLTAAADSSPACGELATRIAGADVAVNAAGLAQPDSAGGADLYGANALLPAVFAVAARRAGVRTAIHISSAAVQGRRPVLDESIEASPFSYYSHSKALGERAFLKSGPDGGTPALLVIRATSVQGPGRRTTESFVRIARSPIASVAGTGAQPTVVSTIDGLVAFIAEVGTTATVTRKILLQPWEGHTAAGVLELAKGESPLRLPRWMCVALLSVARGVGRIVPEVAGAARRLELMWMGQDQRSSHAAAPDIDDRTLADIFDGVERRNEMQGPSNV